MTPKVEVHSVKTDLWQQNLNILYSMHFSHWIALLDWFRLDFEISGLAQISNFNGTDFRFQWY